VIHTNHSFQPANISLDLQQEQPQLYESLTKVLGPEEQQIIQGVFHEADAKAMVAAANAEAAAAAGIQNGN
jgi:recombinational DNA repair protein RecT